MKKGERDMDNKEKIRIAITAGVVAVILLILIAYLALSGKKVDKVKEDELLASGIIEYANSSASDDLVSTDASDAASSQNAAENGSIDASDNSSLVASSQNDKDKKPVNTVSGNSFYKTEAPVLKDNYKKVKYDRDSQLKEMHDYWADGNVDAVRDLAHLERFEAMSYSLKDTKDFYYYGEKDDKDRPNGKGLAVYAGDQYYFGDFVEGKRSGEGSWIAFYPEYANYIVTEHTYTGSWEDDVPNGKGQEHYDYDSDHMNKYDIYLQNAIGNFKNSLYDGDMYIITVDDEGKTQEWFANCTEGKINRPAHASNDENGKIPTLSLKGDEDTHIYMKEKGLDNNGVSGIISGGEAIMPKE